MKLTKNQLFKYIYRFHIYGGLFCSVYLFVVGLSTLNFQHNFLNINPSDTLSYTKNIRFDPSLKADSLARYLASELGIVGHIPPWDLRENKRGFFFKIQRPGRTFDIHLSRQNDLIEIDEIHYGNGRLIKAMHFGSISELNDPLLKWWAWYAQISAVIAFLIITSSIYLWFKKSVKNQSQWLMISASGVFSIFIIFYIWLIG